MNLISLKKHLLVLMVILVLVAVRFLRAEYFYDPLESFFRSDFKNQLQFPLLDFLELLKSYSFTYFLNSFLSIIIIYRYFPKKDILKFLVVLFGLFYVALLVIFILSFVFVSDDFLVFYYIRRFVLNPLLLILILPAYFYNSYIKS